MQRYIYKDIQKEVLITEFGRESYSECYSVILFPTG